MKTEQIHYVLAINHYGSISAAAKALYLSQTTLSAAVKSVEEELRFHLFVRTHSGVTLTPEGEDALVIMKEIDRCNEEIKDLKGSANSQYHPVRLITSPTIHSALSLELNRILKENNLDCSLEFEIVNGAEVGNLMVKNKGNLGVTYLGEKAFQNLKMISSRSRIKMEPLFEDSFYLLVRTDHPLAEHDTISIKSIANMDLAMLENYSSANSMIYREALGPSNRYTTFPSVALIKRYIMTRNACGILTGYAIHCNQSVDSAQMKPILLTDLDRSNRFGMYLFHRAQADLTLQECTVLNYIRSYFKALPFFPFELEDGET